VRAFNWFGLGSLIDTNSAWYTAGEVTGMVAGVLLPTPCGKAALLKGQGPARGSRRRRRDQCG